MAPRGEKLYRERLAADPERAYKTLKNRQATDKARRRQEQRARAIYERANSLALPQIQTGQGDDVEPDNVPVAPLNWSTLFAVPLTLPRGALRLTESALQATRGIGAKAVSWHSKQPGLEEIPLDQKEIDLIKEAAFFANFAYSDGKQKLQGWTTTWLTNDWDWGGCVLYRLSGTRLKMIVAFRGTYSLSDGVLDAYSAASRRLKNGASSLTFAAGPALKLDLHWNQLKRLVIDPLKDALSNGEYEVDLLITGHSLGGGVSEAFAAILAENLGEELFNSPLFRFCVVTFNGMRSLTENTIAYILDHFPRLDENTYLFSADGDPVSKVPATPLFQHLGRHYRVADDFWRALNPDSSNKHGMAQIEKAIDALSMENIDSLSNWGGRGQLPRRRRRSRK